MATWTHTIGAPTTEVAAFIVWRVGPPNPQIDSGLTPAGANRFYQQLILKTSGNNVGLYISLSSLTTSVGTSGHDLTVAWESNEMAIVVEAGGLSLTISGPTHSSAQTQDPTEVYGWVPSAAQVTAIVSFIADYASLTQAQKNATTITLRDELPADPELTIARDLSTVVEGTDATWTITADAAPSSDLTVNVDVTQIGTYIDGTAPTTVTLSSGDTTATLTVPTADDSVDESNGSITATLQTGTGYTLGSAVSSAITITDDDEPDLTPTFSDNVFTQNYTQNVAISTLQLPAATGGDGTLVYSLPSRPPGLNFNAINPANDRHADRYRYNVDDLYGH